MNEWNKVSTDCVNASSVNIFKIKTVKYLGRLYIDEKFSINQWLPCPFAIWIFALDGNLFLILLNLLEYLPPLLSEFTIFFK